MRHAEPSSRAIRVAAQVAEAMYPGPDKREFWQRAEQRNRDTGRLYDKLGRARCEGIEAFVRWDGQMPYL